MSEDYTGYFKETAAPEPEHEAWKGISPEPATPEPEQVPVWVKLVDVSDEMKQGYRQVPVFMQEPPEVTFEYCFKTAGRWIAACAVWSMIYGLVGGLIVAVLRAIFG